MTLHSEGVQIRNPQNFDQPTAPLKIKRKFIFCTHAQFALLLSLTNLSGKPMFPIAQKKKPKFELKD